MGQGRQRGSTLSLWCIAAVGSCRYFGLSVAWVGMPLRRPPPLGSPSSEHRPPRPVLSNRYFRLFGSVRDDKMLVPHRASIVLHVPDLPEPLTDPDLDLPDFRTSHSLCNAIH